jgi:hypothetical protein
MMRWSGVGPALAVTSLAVNLGISAGFQRHLSENQTGIAPK